MIPAEARQKLGLSRAEMARAMGVHRETWAKWERGEREPDNAAVRLMELLCWLNDNRKPTLAQWLKEI